MPKVPFPWAAALVLAGACLLIAAAAAILAREAAQSKVPHPRREAFQQMMGGLGLGPATDLSQCPRAFDARIDSVCRLHLAPEPGAGGLCPYCALGRNELGILREGF